MVSRLWRDDPDAFWKFLRPAASPVVLALAPGSVAYGRERLPAGSGGAVVAANQLAALDSVLISVFFPRPIYWMSKVELFEEPVLGTMLEWTGSFPIRRGSPDREGLRHACDGVRAGHVVGVHLEGTRQRFGYPGEMKGGALWIALRERVPVIPCGIESFQWSLQNRRRCAVVWGDPIETDGLPRGREGLTRAMDLVVPEIVRLWRLAGEAVTEGFPDTLSDGARRSGWVRPGEARS
jgi:1-acyl-sn-glycerol-3-phosphate acyltransferase